MIDEAIQNSKRHSGTETPRELMMEIELDDQNAKSIDLIAIERTWSKRLEQLEIKLNPYNTELTRSISHENIPSEPLARWYCEATADGFFHDIGEVRKLSKVPSVYLEFKTQDQGFEIYGRNIGSDAGATCGLISEVSRGLSRL
ncbi:hypothetical protein TWF192_009524 [Orbilia oligospora]|uniref:Uncharacterized protein n=1 Tax=Orbilia oligospora TaxID=2813651 RepID=A0A6G1M1E6_ORBOL|nr:hypothetical protein TWF679_004440 [Orbilia oligospora]KAF3218868.1 hypothetical protein TWF191_008073 [Orbilia oligospora]KAF3240201.1 hypothetical protein TWF192_009524 [Orbilia oligospora]